MKINYLIKENEVDNILDYLIKNNDIPNIKSVINLYFSYKKDIFEISFIDGMCFVRFYGKSTQNLQITKISDYSNTKPILIENKNIKFFLGTLFNLKLNNAVINTVSRMEFIMGDIKYITQVGTLMGDMLSIENDKDLEGVINNQIKPFIKEKIDIKNVDRKIHNNKFETSNIFDKLGNINPKIKKYMDKFGIDSSLNSKSIKNNLMSKSNDYFFYNSLFKKIFANDIYSVRGLSNFESKIKPISIIIPTYNSDDTILLTLASIESQKLTKENLKKIEVIIVDDGSDNPVKNLIKDDYTFKLKIIRLEENSGRSEARNIGGYSALYNHLIFIDSDILLSNNFLLEHSLRFQSIPKSLFISLKNNINKNDILCNVKNIKKGLEKPLIYNDKRLFREIKKDKINLIKSENNGFYELISDTSFLSNFGYGRIINGYDLPSLIVSHNLSISKESFIKTGGFSIEFKG
jgi:hypothetical protein